MDEGTVNIKSNIRHLAILLGLLAIAHGPAQAQINACDLNNDGTVNVVDVQLAIDMTLGTLPCTTNIDGAGLCNVVVVQRIVNAALGQGCVTNHWVSLTWTASSSTNVAGYNLYRGTASTGPFTKVNLSLITSTTVVDNTVVPGQTYYYVATTVDTSNNESAYSSPAVQAVVPSP
jgi:hypothetical protein